MLFPAFRQSFEDRVQRQFEIPEPFPVRGGSERDLDVPGSLRGFVRAELARDPFEVFGFAQTRSGETVAIGERPKPGERGRFVRQFDSVGGRQFLERAGTDGALEVDVEVHLGKGGKIAHASDDARRPRLLSSRFRREPAAGGPR